MVLFAGVARAQQPGTAVTQVSTTAYFAFHGDVSTNLHAALYHAARARLVPMPTTKPMTFQLVPCGHPVIRIISLPPRWNSYGTFSMDT
jgi:hypothetical protein